MSGHPRAQRLGVVGCHACALVCEDAGAHGAGSRCPRCRAPLHRRRPDSIGRTWALLAAAVICYIPANILPVMTTSLLGSGSDSDSTIMSGVIQFWRHGSYGIALIIFIASVFVPCMKFLALALLLVTAQRRSRWAMRERAVLYRIIERTGYWSMLDVLVVALVAALVRFHGLSEIQPGAGIFFFGITVILTMLSALNFDPRLIWDGELS